MSARRTSEDPTPTGNVGGSAPTGRDGPGDGSGPDPATASDVSVVICAYTAERWELLCASVDSVLRQARPPRELFVCVDHNPELFERCRSRWNPGSTTGTVPVHVVENRYDGHLGSARTTAAELAQGAIVAFLDDDAAAAPDWLERMVEPFDDPAVVAVGGSPHPQFAVPRPRWFPPEYDWVFGCAYVGLPTVRAPILHVIGAAMAVRREDLAAIGYFHSDNHDDMDMCHRLLHHAPSGVILFEPGAVVRHHVPAHRLTWRYFWRRCFSVNRGKVGAFRQMGGASNLRAERRFARKVLTQGLRTGGRDVLGGDVGGFYRSGAMCAGLALAGAGYATGVAEWYVRRTVRPASPRTPGRDRAGPGRPPDAPVT